MPIRSHEETFRVVKAWAKEERETLRSQLESTKLTETQTAIRRGRIAQLKDLLNKLEDHHV